MPCHQLRNFAKTFLESLNLFSSDMVPFADRCFSKIVNQNKYGIGVTQVKNMYFQLINSDMESKLEMNIWIIKLNVIYYWISAIIKNK